MLPSKRLRSIVILASLVPLASPLSICAAENIVGRVHSQDGVHVHACFDAATTIAADAQFAVVRHLVLSQPKGPVTTRSERKGVIRLVSIGTDRCAEARLVRGSAQSLDWLVADPAS